MPLCLKNMSKCVFVLDRLKSQCKLIILWRSTCSKKSWLGGHFFQNLGSQGPGCVSPDGSLRAAPLTFLAACCEAEGGFNCVGKVPLKSQCKKYGIWEGKIKPHLGKVCIFLPTLFSKNHRNIML